MKYNFRRWQFLTAVAIIVVVLSPSLINIFHVVGLSISDGFHASNFFENFFADALVAIIFGMFFPLWFKSLDRPRQVEIINRITNCDIIMTSLNSTETEREFSAKLDIKNTGRVPILNLVYVHIFIPIHIQYFVGGPVKTQKMTDAPAGFNYIRAQISVPIYPTSRSEFIELKGTLPLGESVNDYIEYSIVTEFGDYPRIILNDGANRLKLLYV